jgi:hypothetical protein
MPRIPAQSTTAMQPENANIPAEEATRGPEAGAASGTFSVRSTIVDDTTNDTGLVGTGTDAWDEMLTRTGDSGKGGVASSRHEAGAGARDDDCKGNAGDCSTRY